MLSKKCILSALFIVSMSCFLKAMDEPIHDTTHENLNKKHESLLNQWKNNLSMWLTGKPTQTFIDKVTNKIHGLNCTKELLDDDYTPHLQCRTQEEMINLQEDLKEQLVDIKNDLAPLPNNLRKKLITKHVDSDSLRETLIHETLNLKEETNKELSAQEIKKSNCKPHNNYPELLAFKAELERKQKEYEIFNNNMWAAINVVGITAACGVIVGACYYAYKKW